MKAHWISAACLTLLLAAGLTVAASAQQSPSSAPATTVAPSTPSTLDTGKPATQSPSMGTPATQSPSMQQNPSMDGQTGVATAHRVAPWILAVIALIVIFAAVTAMRRRRDGTRRSTQEPYVQPRA